MSYKYTQTFTPSYGRRALVENTNSVLRTGLARLSKGYFRVFGRDNVALLVGLALAALNLKMAEKSRRHDEVEVIEFDLEDDRTQSAAHPITGQRACEHHAKRTENRIRPRGDIRICGCAHKPRRVVQTLLEACAQPGLTRG